MFNDIDSDDGVERNCGGSVLSRKGNKNQNDHDREFLHILSPLRPAVNVHLTMDKMYLITLLM
jgi:hypothetical protein